MRATSCTSDPATATPSGNLGSSMAAPRSSRRRAHRTWPQRLLIVVGVVSVGLFAAAVYVLNLAQDKASNVERIAISTGVLAEEVTIDEPRNILVVGVDSAAGLDPDDPRNSERGATTLTDTMMIIRLDPQAERVTLLSLPRDLWVSVGGQDVKLNQAVAMGGGPDRGGIELLIESIRDNFAIPINNFVQVDFATFLGVVEAIDGVPYYLENPVRDLESGLLISRAGCQTINADDALAFVRSRKGFQEQIDGEWQFGLGSDLVRIERQQQFVVAMAERAISKGARNPVTLNDLVNAVLDDVQIDTRLVPDEIVDLGDQFRTFRTSNLETVTFNGLYDIVEGPGQGSLGMNDTPENQAITARFLGLASSTESTADGSATTAGDAAQQSAVAPADGGQAPSEVEPTPTTPPCG